jgi:glycogen synthase
MEGDSTPRRILMTADTVGGVWTYALELAAELARHSIHVALATMGALLTADQWREVRALPNVEVFESSFRLEWMDEPWPDVKRAGDWLLDIEQDFQPDLIHLNGYAHGSLPWSAPTLVVGHSCVLSWWFAVKNIPLPECFHRYRDAVRDGLQNGDLVIAPSQTMLEFLEVFYGPLARAGVIPNGRRRVPFDVLSKERVVLTAGRLWDEAKNIEALAHAAHRLHWPVCLAGEGRHPNGTMTRFDNVHLLGRLSSSEMSQWYARSAIYALPARYEPFGLSAVEAANAGCALVLGDIGSLREIWDDAALFVRPGDHERLCLTLLSLMEDDSLRYEYARKARRRAQRYTPEGMANGYLRAYNALLGRARNSKLPEEVRA